MDVFAAFVRKEFLHIFRDKRTMLILLVMPVVMIVIFGFALSNEINNINLAVVSSQRNEMVRQLVERFDANHYFTIVGEYATAEPVEHLLRAGKANMAIVFGADFDRQPSVQLIVDASNPNIASNEVFYTSSVIRKAMAEMRPTTQDEAVVTTHLRMLYNPQMRSSYNFVPGIMGLIFILISALMTSISIVREKEQGTMEVLLASPVRPIYIILSKMVPYLVISCFNLLTILLLAYLLLDVPVTGGIAGLCILSLVYIILSLALGLFISTVVNTQAVAMLGSVMTLMLPVMLLSGMIFPIESMPKVLQYISDVIPAKWYIMAARKMMIEGQTLAQVYVEASILTGMTVVLMVLSLKNFKNRLG